jgi:glycosyltransferase involved in cell wall biosynthesis
MTAPGRRVLVLSHMFPHPEQPGSGPFILEQVQALRRAGVDARVVCGRPFWLTSVRSPLKLLVLAPRIASAFITFLRVLFAARRGWRVVDGVPVRYVPYLVVAPFWSHAWCYRVSMRCSLLLLRREFAPDVVHAHTAYLDGSAARMLSRAWRLPYVVTEHTGPFSVLMHHRTIRRTTLQSLREADAMVSVSRALEREILGYLGEPHPRPVVVPNVVDTDRFASGSPARGRPEALRLLFVGFFVPVKNLPLLLDAFTVVLERRPHVTLDLVGGGETPADTQAVVRDVAQRGLSHAVRVHGFAARDEVARLMREACDIFVLPSRTETFGVVAAEALASGRPVVATRCGGPEDIVTEPWMGALCANGDPKSLAQAILDVADRLDGIDAERLAASARERFGGGAVARRLMQVYDDVLAPREQRLAAPEARRP